MAQKLFYNANVITMDEQFPFAEAILLDDGKIVQLGMDKDFSSLNCPKKDMKGLTILPSFLDAHGHFSAYAAQLMQASLAEVSNENELRETIKKYIEDKQISKDKWIIASGLDLNQYQSNNPLNRYELDKIVQNNPILVKTKSGHSGILNSKGLEALCINENSQEPEGGKIQRDKNGPTGYLEENALFENEKKIPMGSLDDYMNAYKEAEKKYFSYGITTIQEGLIVAEMLPLYEKLLDQEWLNIDIVGYASLDTYEKLTNLFPKSKQQYHHHFKIGGIKLFLDGSPQDQTAWMKIPYATNPNNFGYGTMSDDELSKALIDVARFDTQVIAHCNGDAAIEQYIKELSKAIKLKPNIKENRPVIIHAQFLAKNQLRGVKENGMIPSFFGAHIFYFGDTHIHNLGYERASHISMARSTIAEGITMTLHQDEPVTEPNMLKTIAIMSNRLTKNKVILGEDEIITPLEAIKALTINVAYQYHEEKIKGSITPSKYADFVVIEKNIISTSPEEISAIQILETIKNGETVWLKS